MLDQFSNPGNPLAHELTTGPEILAQLPEGKKLAAFVASFGTGGTVTGVARALRKKFPDVHVAAVEPASSPLVTQGRSGAHAIQGIGANFVPACLAVGRDRRIRGRERTRRRSRRRAASPRSSASSAEFRPARTSRRRSKSRRSCRRSAPSSQSSPTGATNTSASSRAERRAERGQKSKRGAQQLKVDKNLKDQMLFIKKFVTEPRTIGSVAPSSPQLVDSMLQNADWAKHRRGRRARRRDGRHDARDNRTQGEGLRAARL